VNMQTTGVMGNTASEGGNMTHGYNAGANGIRGNEMPNIQNMNSMNTNNTTNTNNNNYMYNRQNSMNFNQTTTTPTNQNNNFQQFPRGQNQDNQRNGPFPAAAATLHMQEQPDQMNSSGKFMDNQQYQVHGQTQFQARSPMNPEMNRPMFNKHNMGGYMNGPHTNMGGYMNPQRSMYGMPQQHQMQGSMNSQLAAAAAQRNMMRYPGPPLKGSLSMVYNQTMMGGSPMTPDTPNWYWKPIGKAGPFPPQYQSPPSYNGSFGPNMGGMNRNNIGMAGSMTNTMGMPPQYSLMNIMNNPMANNSMANNPMANNPMASMMNQPPPTGIQPMANQRRPSTLQHQPSLTPCGSAIPPQSPVGTPRVTHQLAYSNDQIRILEESIGNPT